MNISKWLLLALTIASEFETVGSLQPGELEELPVIHLTEKDLVIDVAVTVNKRPKKA